MTRAGGLLSALVWAACGAGASSPDAPNYHPPDGGDEFATCGSANAFGTCFAGEKCSWIIDAHDPTAENCAGVELGHVACVPLGTKQEGDECEFDFCNDGTTPGSDGTCDDGKPAIGADDCGLASNGQYMFCIAHRCEQVCDVNGGAPACDSDHVCSQHADTYTNGTSPALAGVCDERCDPVSQRSLDTQKEACGSVAVAESGSGSAEVYPELGCYEDDHADASARLVDFTCSDTPFGRAVVTIPPQCGLPAVTDPVEDRQDCTDDESCTVTDQGMQFKIPNGCAPGYVNLLDASSQTGAAVICSAYCAPLDSDTTQVNDQGDPTVLGKDVTDVIATAGRATCKTLQAGGKALGSDETCIYGWQFALDANTHFLPIHAGPRDIDKIGLCFENSQYTYDPTGGSNATKAQPECHTLLPGHGCTTAEDTCGSGALCTDNAGTVSCHATAVACGSGSGNDANGDDTPGNEADCFALDHGCYDSVEEGAVDPSAGSGSSTVRGRTQFGPAVQRRMQIAHQVNERVSFRRPGGIH